MAREQLIPTERSKSQLAYQWIRERIGTAEFAPGYRLVLSTIATDTGMSVVPVREAIRQLEAEGMVTFQRNIGAHVSMIDDSQYRHCMQTLGIVEGAATALAAPHLTKADIKRARAVNRRMIQILDPFDPHQFTVLNQEFHAVLFSRCPNERLLEVVTAEWDRLGHLRDSTFTFVPGRAAGSVREHDMIVALIERSAPPEEIELAARRHRETTLDSYLNHEHSSESSTRAAG